MSTPPHIWRPRNRQRPCSVRGCHRRRIHTSTHCRPHRRAVYLHGHHQGRCVRKKEIAPYRRVVGSFLDGHADTIQVRTATKLIQDLLLGSPLSFPKAGQRLSTLVSDGITARDVLEVAGACWLLSRYQPRTLPDDQRLTFQIGYHVLRLRPFPTRQAHQWAEWGQDTTKVISIAPGGPARREAGEFVRQHLGVFFMRVAEGIEAERSAKATREQTERDTLATTFPINPNEPEGNQTT